MMRKHIEIGCLFLFLGACQEIKTNFELPILGRNEIATKEVNGILIKDTIPHRIADFSFINQDSAVITNASFKDKIYVADFFFINCPSICPEMSKQMYRVYKEFLENESQNSRRKDVNNLKDEIAKAGINGIAYDFDENNDGISAVGSSFIIDNEIYSISIPVPSHRFNIKQKELEKNLKEAIEKVKPVLDN